LPPPRIFEHFTVVPISTKAAAATLVDCTPSASLPFVNDVEIVLDFKAFGDNLRCAVTVKVEHVDEFAVFGPVFIPVPGRLVFPGGVRLDEEVVLEVVCPVDLEGSNQFEPAVALDVGRLSNLRCSCPDEDSPHAPPAGNRPRDFERRSAFRFGENRMKEINAAYETLKARVK
jgi:hypothetical protein